LRFDPSSVLLRLDHAIFLAATFLPFLTKAFLALVLPKHRRGSRAFFQLFAQLRPR
jgi:hypothetical protein